LLPRFRARFGYAFLLLLVELPALTGVLLELAARFRAPLVEGLVRALAPPIREGLSAIFFIVFDVFARIAPSVVLVALLRAPLSRQIRSSSWKRNQALFGLQLPAHQI
jgi:hypothetical protein